MKSWVQFYVGFEIDRSSYSLGCFLRATDLRIFPRPTNRTPPTESISTVAHSVTFKSRRTAGAAVKSLPEEGEAAVICTHLFD